MRSVQVPYGFLAQAPRRLSTQRSPTGTSPIESVNDLTQENHRSSQREEALTIRVKLQKSASSRWLLQVEVAGAFILSVV